MVKVGARVAAGAALLLGLTGCFPGGASNLTLESAQQKLETSNIPCENPRKEKLADVLPTGEGEDGPGGTALICQNEESGFAVYMFDKSSDIRVFLDLACKANAEEADVPTQEVETLWGPNWFAFSVSDDLRLTDLQKALGGEIADFYSKC